MKARLLAAAIAAGLLTLARPVPATEIQVNVTGLGADAGEIGCALHNPNSDFPTGHDGVQIVWVKPQDASARCVFPNVTNGTYAVAVSLDLNGNKKTDTNFLGLPQEAWGVSGNIRPRMRAPRFSEAAFVVSGKSVVLNVEVAK